MELQAAIGRLAETPRALAHLVAEVTDARLDRAPAGEWTPRTVMAHLRDDEHLCMRLALERLLAEDEPTLRFLDGADWEPRRNRARDRKEVILADFALQRQASLVILQSLGPGDRDRRGRGANGEPLTIADLAATWVAHDAEHVAQLERLLGETVAEARARRARRDD